MRSIHAILLASIKFYKVLVYIFIETVSSNQIMTDTPFTVSDPSCLLFQGKTHLRRIWRKHHWRIRFCLDSALMQIAHRVELHYECNHLYPISIIINGQIFLWLQCGIHKGYKFNSKPSQSSCSTTKQLRKKGWGLHILFQDTCL